MKQIDLKPVDYRTQDAETGRWIEHVNKPLCRWLGIVGLLFCGYMAWGLWSEGTSPWPAIFMLIMGFACGALITLSLKSIDW